MIDSDVNPLVSIIMPAYNSSNFIKDSIESVIIQSYENWELLITDDCSIDNTFEVLKKYESQDKRIKVFSLNKNSGAAVARNRSLDQAKGDFIAFLDSDDRWLPRKLEKQVNFMIEHDVSLSYTDYSIVNEQEEILGVILSPSSLDYKKMLKNDYIGFLTVMYNSSKLGKHPFPLIRKRQDWALLLNLFKIVPNAYGVQEVLATYKKRESSISAKKHRLLKYIWYVYRRSERLSILESIFYLLTYPLNYYIKQRNCFTENLE